MRKIKKRSDCPISYALDFFGDKWTFLIIRDLALEGKRFYKDFLGSKEGVATNILSNRLKKLERIGVIQSKVYEKLKTQKVYSLTQKGKDLIPILVEMLLWSAEYGTEMAIPASFLHRAKTDKENLIAELMARLS